MKTLKVKSISVMLVFTLLMTVFMPLTVSARTVTSMGDTAGENGLDHFSLSSEGLLTWTSRSIYYDKVRLLDATGKLLDHKDIDVISSEPPIMNSTNIINWMDSLELDTGKYTIMVDPWFGGSVGFGLEDYIYYNYTSPYEKLEAPVNLRWDGNTAKWDANSKATSYQLNIYDASGNKVVSGVSTSSTSYGYSSASDGYWFEVKAKSNSSSPIYRDSNYSESPRKGTNTRTVTPMGDTTGENGLDHFSLSSEGLLTWTSRSIYYDKVRLLDATGKLLDHKDIDVISSEPPIMNSTNIINWMDSLELDTGKYTIMVDPWFGGSVGFGLEDYIYYNYTSPYEKLEAPVNLRWDGNTAKWDANSKATSYQLNIYDASGNKVVSGVSTSSTSYGYSSASDGYWFEVKAKSNSSSPIYRDSNYSESPRKLPTSLTLLNAIVTVPSVGLTIGDLVLTSGDSSKYSVSAGYWKLNDSGSVLDKSSTQFEAGQTYTLYLTYYPENEYVISEDATYTVNGIPTEWSGFEAESNRKINFTIPDPATQISELSATVTAPVGGEHPSFTVTVPDGAHYTAVVYAWYDLNNNGAHLTNSDTFVTGNEYQARIHFTANTGYEIANSASYTINGTPNYAAFDEKQRGMIFVALEKTLIDSSSKFIDVPSKAWYKKFVDYSVTYGIFTGTSSNTFSPNTDMTRAQFVQVFANISGVDTSNKNVNSGFSDVPKGKWYTAAVTWAAKNGIVSGVGDGKFDPDAKVTREQMCVMIVNYIENYQKRTLNVTANASTFADDKNISKWAKTAVYKCAKAGLVSGVGDGKFDPKASATRAQGATIFTNFFKEYMK